MENKKSENPNPEKTTICHKAVISLILAIICPFTILGILLPNVIFRNLSLFAPLITCFLAIDFGIIGLKNIKASKGRLKGKGLAVSGIIIAPLLFSLLFIIFVSSLGKLKDIGWRMTCERHLTEIGKAMLVYIDDFDRYPTHEKWCELLVEECNVPPDFFRCPVAEEGPCNYALNKNISDIGTSAQGDIVLLFETHPGWN